MVKSKDERRVRAKRRAYLECRLMNMPVLGYFFRKIAEYRQPIETALRTNQKTREKVYRASYLGGLITTISTWTIDTLKLQGKR